MRLFTFSQSRISGHAASVFRRRIFGIVAWRFARRDGGRYSGQRRFRSGRSPIRGGISSAQVDASGNRHPEQPKILPQKDEEEMICEVAVIGAFALATLRRCVYIAEFYPFSLMHVYLALFFFLFCTHVVSGRGEVFRAQTVATRKTKTDRGYVKH